MTIGMMDKIGGESYSFLSLAASINEASGTYRRKVKNGENELEETSEKQEIEEERKYNSAQKAKVFDGNIKLFARNPFQYKKRFHKGDCCTSENMIEWTYKGEEKDPIEYRYREEFKNLEVKHKDFIGDTLHICKKCGYVEESKSNVKPAEEIKEDILSKLDRAIFKAMNDTTPDNEPEPNENEIRELAKKFGF